MKSRAKVPAKPGEGHEGASKLEGEDEKPRTTKGEGGKQKGAKKTKSRFQGGGNSVRKIKMWRSRISYTAKRRENFSKRDTGGGDDFSRTMDRKRKRGEKDCHRVKTTNNKIFTRAGGESSPSRITREGRRETSGPENSKGRKEELKEGKEKLET